MEWEPVIGLEVHAQLLTKSKMFCSCPADYQDNDPNTGVCPVCLAMPGTLPVINKQAVEYVIRTGLALNCDIGEFAQFDRKNYSYPDLMKGYQISQFENPISYGGWMIIESDGEARQVGITRAHLEEDVAKLQHARDGAGAGHALMDVNRAGVPLMEVVGDPDLRTPDEARQYLLKLRSILQYIGVSTADMDQGSFRCDANVSVRPKGTTEYGTKVEVKNMNSLRAVYRSLEYEIQRQIELLESGGVVAQETRGWLEEKGVTVSQRSKEYANDYRYLPEPDLPPLLLSREWVEEVRAQLPELPDARRERLQLDYGLSPYDASLLTATRRTADFFEEAVAVRRAGGRSAPSPRQGHREPDQLGVGTSAEPGWPGALGEQGHRCRPIGARRRRRRPYRQHHAGQAGAGGDVRERRGAPPDSRGQGAFAGNGRGCDSDRRARSAGQQPAGGGGLSWAARRTPPSSWWAR